MSTARVYYRVGPCTRLNDLTISTLAICSFIFCLVVYFNYQSLSVTQIIKQLIPDAPMEILSKMNLTASDFYKQLTINNVNIETYFENNINQCVINDNIIIFDIVFIHSKSELNILEMRIFEYTKYVNHFIIVEYMYYDTGQKRNNSYFNDAQNIKYIHQNYKIISENWHKLITKQVYLSYYDIGINEGIQSKRDELTVSYWLSMVRNHQAQILYDECYKLYGSKCVTDNYYVTYGDLDEIIRSDILILLFRCSNIIETPITMNIIYHFYDFNCIDYGNWVIGKTQIHKIKDISFDSRNNNNFQQLRRWGHSSYRLIMYPKENFTIVNQAVKRGTQINSAGWHLSSFGDVNDVLFKHIHKGHSIYRSRKQNLNKIFLQCLINLCGVYGGSFSKNSTRVKYIDFNNKYYPLYVRQKIYNKYPKNIFLKERIETDSKLFDEWNKYIEMKNHSDA
eukprot:299704_1